MHDKVGKNSKNQIVLYLGLVHSSCKNQGINHLGSVPPSLYCLWDVNLFGTLSNKHVLFDDSIVESFYWFGVKINRLISKLIQRNEVITHSFVCGYRIRVITSAFQADDVSSILTIRSIGKIAKLVNAQDCKSLG